MSLAGIGAVRQMKTQAFHGDGDVLESGLIPESDGELHRSDATGSLSFTRRRTPNGSATITVTVNDGQAANNTIVRTFGHCQPGEQSADAQGNQCSHDQ